MAESENRYRMDVPQILRYLPHRAPFLMIDRVLEIHPNGDLNDFSPANMVGIRVVTQKCVSYNEPYFVGHFPNMPILPGVLITEMMAQTASMSLYPYIEHRLEEFAKSFQTVLTGMDNVRFRKPVFPGDVVKATSIVTRCRGSLWLFHCEAFVADQRVAEADFMANFFTGDFGQRGKERK